MEVSGPIFDERGQDLIEYSLLLAFIALASISLFTSTAKSRSASFSKIKPQIEANAANYATREAFYVTDRNLLGLSKKAGYYGADRADENAPLRFGTCAVSIPRDHKEGELETRSLLA